MLTGKAIRLERIIDRSTKRTVIVPLDHGVSVGPIKGLTDMKAAVNMAAEGGANAVLGHIGLPLHGHRTYGSDVGLILHLSASTALGPDPHRKVQVNTVQHALKMGADAVSVHINIGSENEADQLAKLGYVSIECREWGMPLLAMMYPRGEKIKSEHDVEAVKLSVRTGAELGADLVKTNYTGDPDSFKEVVQGAMDVPVIIAGGAKESIKGDEDLLRMVHDSIKAGGSGTSIGRNIFQHEKPVKMLKAIVSIVHEEAAVEEAMKHLR
jgi:fructose-bisphosphate aldolase/2-amino-3,7-dideoxy-D-threo-hept-6-ulosonate synthase